MIVRIWHGVTPAIKADDYYEFLGRTGIPDYRGTEGNQGVMVLRRVDGSEAHFLLLSFWRSVENIEKFAGADVARARYYPEDRDYLLAFEENAVHYELLNEEAFPGRS
jgi:heme-degrading monooxygenase HmoA